MEPSNDDNLLEVVAVLGATQMVSRSIGSRNGIYTKRMRRILYEYFIANCKLLFYENFSQTSAQFCLVKNMGAYA